MKKIKLHDLNLLRLLLLNNNFWIATLIFLTASINLYAEQASNGAVDCGEAEIRYIDSPELTRAERIALMEKAFFDSLNRFELCELTDPSDSSSADSSSSGGGGTASGDQGGEQNQQGNMGNDSVASEEMQGTEPERDNPSSSQADSANSTEFNNDGIGNTATSGGVNNGATPEDIPAANNDDAIAAQIRVAAEAEQDPEIKQKLWNEYRKYKGMDIVED